MESMFGEAHLMYERKRTYTGKRVYRRHYKRQRNIMLLISSLCLALALAVIFGSFLSEAEAKESHIINITPMWRFSQETLSGIWPLIIWMSITSPVRIISEKFRN